MLRRSLSVQKWVSLLLLTIGVALVQLPTHPAEAVEKKEGFFHKHFSFSRRAIGGHTHATDASDLGMVDEMNPTLGLTAVFTACMLSGLAGVYFEKVLKGSSASLWVRNVQLSFFSLFPALFIGVLWKDGSDIMDKVNRFIYITNG
jgi:UDP-galactose transporter